MEVTTIANVVAMATEMLESAGDDLAADSLQGIAEAIFSKISLFSKWNRQDIATTTEVTSETDDNEEDEVINFHYGK